MNLAAEQPTLQLGRKYSPLLPLFFHLMFEQSTLSDGEQSEDFDEIVYPISENFSLLVFHNGDFDVEDNSYIYLKVNDFESQLDIIDKGEVMMFFMRSEEYYSIMVDLIDNEIQQDDESDYEDLKNEATEILKNTYVREMEVNNAFHSDIKDWLIRKCKHLAINFSESEPITLENMKSHIDYVLKRI